MEYMPRSQADSAGSNRFASLWTVVRKSFDMLTLQTEAVHNSGIRQLALVVSLTLEEDRQIGPHSLEYLKRPILSPFV